MVEHEFNITNLNKEYKIDIKLIEQNMGRTNAYIKKQPNAIEQSFMFWYVSVFGDEWKLIADVLNYHPFTKGCMRDPDELRYYFFAYSDVRGHIYSPKLQVEPIRVLELPLLIN